MPTTEKWILTISVPAASDQSANFEKLVKLDASGDFLVCAAATDIPIGVLLDKPNAAGIAGLIGVIGIGFAQGDAALNEFDLVGPSSDGQLDAKIAGTDTTEYVIGQVLEGSGAAGDLVKCVFNFATPHRAA